MWGSQAGEPASMLAAHACAVNEQQVVPETWPATLDSSSAAASMPLGLRPSMLRVQHCTTALLPAERAVWVQGAGMLLLLLLLLL